MTVCHKMFCPLFYLVLLNSTSVAQPCPNVVLDIQTMHRRLVEPGSQKNRGAHEFHNPSFRGKSLSAGSWGGLHISMLVTAEQAKIEYDCAHGTISSKILLDSRGRFVVRGTHVEEHGGPIRQGNDRESYPVRFNGSVKGKNMKLTVTRTDTRQLIGTFRLTHGQESELVKCR